MTREEAREVLIVKAGYGDFVEDIIDQIFDDHEAQLKAKEEEIKDLQTAMIKLNEHYHIAKSELGAQLKQHAEEIERLKNQLSSVHNIMYRNGYSDAIDCYDTFGNFNTRHKPNAKARLIVAMLFWEWKRHKRMYELSKFERYLAVTHLNNATLTKIILDKAYKMLKDTK